MDKEVKKDDAPVAAEPIQTPTPAPTPIQTTPVAAHPSEGLAIAALIIGISSLVFCWVPFLGFLLGVGAIIFGAIAAKKKQSKGMSITGIVTGGLSTLAGIAMTVLFFLGFALLSTGLSGLSGLENDYSDYYNDTQNQQDDSSLQTTFLAGDTAVFNNLNVKINTITRNVSDPDGYYEPSVGNEYIKLNLSVTNNSSESQYISGYYDFLLRDNGIADYPTYLSIAPELEGGYLSPGATTTGNLVFEVTADSTDLALQYETNIYDEYTYNYDTVTYTLDLY